MEQLIARFERVLTGFEQLFEAMKAQSRQAEEDTPAPVEKKSSYQYGEATAHWIKKVDDGNSCIQELIDFKVRHEQYRAKKGYPIDKSYHGPLAEAIEVLEARQPVTVSQLLGRIETDLANSREVLNALKQPQL